MKKPINVQFTREGFEKLKTEYDELLASRPEAVVKLTQMREMGDLSENAGYHAAKEKLGQIDHRLRELKLLLRFGEIIEDAAGDVVDLGTRVTVENNDGVFEYTIVGGMEADPSKNKLSNTSPIGSALMGKEAGDSITIETPNGSIAYKIKAIKAS